MEIRGSDSIMKLILGGSGFIGSNFTSGVKLSSTDVNLLNYDNTLKCFQKYNPDIIIHSACKQLSSKLLYENSADYFDENVRMSLNIFKASRSVNVKKLIIIASINAFIDDQKSLISDSYNHNIKKILSDEYYHQYDLSSNVIFLSNVYGPNYKNNTNGFIPFIIEKCHEAKQKNIDLYITGNPNHTRNFIFVKDVIDKIESSNDIHGHMTIANDNYYSLESVVNKIAKIMNYTGKIIWQGQFDSVGSKYLDNNKIPYFNDMNFTSLDEGLEYTIKWYLENET
jgi:GDP-L-fucose synthase